MNYEFHVGDYVEDMDGRVGYISKICDCEKCKERGWYEPSIKYTNGTEDYISNYDVKSIPDCYIRIGAYDFTKKEKKKIEPLNIQGYLSTQTVASVVNELVDAVNFLLDKSTES